MTRFFGIVWVFVLGCTPILDFDALGAGREQQVDTGTQDLRCTSPEDCDDGIDCTIERCSEDGICLEPWPDNDKCGYLEKCLRDSGCVPTGGECETTAECDDDIDCTEDSCVLGKCRHLPDDSACTPSDPCIVDRVCDREQGCLGGVTKSCAAARPVPDMTCRIARCNPEDGSCSIVELFAGADDDSDGYLDAQICDVAQGAADCDDEDAEVHPGAEEICDLRDNDCDGLVDLAASSPPQIIDSAEAGALVSADLASGGDGIAVVWQKNGASGGILARIFKDGGQPETSPGELAAEGSAPAVVADDEGYFAVWASKADGTGALEGVGFSLDGAQSAVEARGDITTIWDGEPRVFPPLRGYHQGGAARVAFVGQYGDGTAGVVFLPLEKGTDAPGVIGRSEKAIEGFDVAPGAEELAFVVARSVMDLGDVDHEVFSAVVSAPPPEDTELQPLSKAQSGVLDPSREPWVTRTPSGGFLAAFSDVAVDEVTGEAEEDFDIRGGLLDGTAALFGIVVDDGSGANVVDQRCQGLATSGDDTGVLFSQQFPAFGAVTLDFRLLQPDGAQRPKQAGRLARLEDGSELAGARLVPTASGFAAVWMTRNASAGDLLWLSAFEGCRAPSR